MAPPFDLPWPCPLDEGVSEEVYNTFISTPDTSTTAAPATQPTSEGAPSTSQVDELKLFKSKIVPYVMFHNCKGSIPSLCG